MIQWTLEHFHIVGGLPWWAAIAATAILMRAATFPLFLRSADQTARTAALSSVTKPIAERIQAAQKSGDQTAVMQAWNDMKAVRKRAGLSYAKQFTPMIAQSVLGFCSFKLMRGMANLPVPGLQDGGFGWLTDLTINDGYLILPAIMAGAMHMMFRYGGETGQSNEMMNPAMRSFMLWVMPGMIFVITGWQPGAVCIWFVASGGWAMGQAMIMQKPAARKFFGLAPIYRPKPGEGSDKGLMDVVVSQAKARNGGNGPRTIEAAATSKRAAPSEMTWQAPKVRTTNARGAAYRNGAVPRAPKEEGVLGSLQGKWADMKERMNEELAMRNERKNKEAVTRAAQSYEKRAKAKQANLQKRGGQ